MFSIAGDGFIYVCMSLTVHHFADKKKKYELFPASGTNIFLAISGDVVLLLSLLMIFSSFVAIFMFVGWTEFECRMSHAIYVFSNFERFCVFLGYVGRTD